VSGWGVKGQAVLLKPARAMPDDLPILYRGGTYVIAHESGLVAAGSTSERDFADALPDQETIATLAANAIDLCPALAGLNWWKAGPASAHEQQAGSRWSVHWRMTRA
jgi:glycine oxidase